MNFNNNRDELDSIEDIIFPISSSFIEDPELNFLNFYLGREINLAGELIYTGFEAIVDNQPLLKNKTQFSFLNARGSFIFLVDTSIAFERLNKVILLLLLYIHKHDQFSAFFKAKSKNNIQNSMDENIYTALYSHSNIKVLAEINKLDSTLFELAKEERILLTRFDEFYKNFRYGRFSPTTSTYYEEISMVQSILSKINGDDKDQALAILGKRIRRMASKYYTAITTLSSKLYLFIDELHAYSNSYYVYFQDEENGPYDTSLFDVFTLKTYARQEILYALIYNELPKKNAQDPWLVKPLNLYDIDLTNFFKYGTDNYLFDNINQSLLDEYVLDNYDERWDSFDSTRKNKEIKKMIIEREKNIAAFLNQKTKSVSI
ncbi:hypothetical protein [Leuconostoc mesenteroides]|uniref:hypothetical protein n=4 Tax=Leuconostoc mesenteroides TaxID=1245 RepID=UPI0023621B79|nr:hypothetical protein [Leuconostoc mesenteroides]